MNGSRCMIFEKPKCTALDFQRDCRSQNLKNQIARQLYFHRGCRAQNLKNLNERQLDFQGVRFKRHILSTNIVIYKTFPDGNVLNTK